ncbi:glycoside hydrolase family 73 protein [Lacticaseibacillus jixiensis]|uniref:glycoside hydrolase family 73 protein n=1 Tax=Lacticaseibacillus jixiensis TaxID=3231926 RepID=UPI0036F1D5BF
MTLAKRHRNKRRHQLPKLLVALICLLGLGVIVVACQSLQGPTSQQAASSSDDTAQKRAFIKQLAPYAQTLHRQYGVLASITLAQAILESDWGQSTLATDYNNYFGIKSADPARSQELTTQEYVNGKWVTIKARFAVYPNVNASLKAHALLFVNGTSYNPDQYKDVLAAKDYVAASVALRTDGYATDPDYPAKLQRLIKQWDLAQYDQ